MKVKDYLSSYDKVAISNTNIYFDKKEPQYAWFMDINMINNSKGKAINILLKYLNINKDQTICFGDQMNDYPMFESCKYSVAMINGNEELKKKLLATEQNILAECAVQDKIWGIGLSMKDEKRFYMEKWQGQNLLGFSLMCVREMLK